MGRSITLIFAVKELRTLYWEDIDLENVGVCADYLSSGNPFTSNHSQILDGHYYYLRHKPGKQDAYIIYQDEGKVIGKFNVDGDMDIFLKYKDRYYVSYYDGDDQLSRINVEKEMDAVCSGDSWYCGEIPLMIGSPFWLYDNCVFYYPGYSIEEGTGNRIQKNEEDVKVMAKAPLSNLADVKEVKIPNKIIENKPYLVFADGKIFYGEENRGKINLYSYDMETNTELKFFSFRQKKRRIKDKVKIQLDKDYIYCGDYLIPLSGGPIQIIDNKNKKIDYSYNEKYIYYIDEKFYVHRVDKKMTENNSIINQVKAMKVDATD